MLLDDVLDTLLLKVFELILLEEKTNLGTTPEWRVDSVGCDGEGTASGRLPDVLLVIVVLGDDLHTLSNEVGGVETDTKLANHGDISARAEGLHEALGSGLGDRTKVVDHVGLGHTNTGIADGEDLVLLVGDETDVEILARVEDRGICQRLVTDLVECIGGVGDDFTKEDLLVGVESVYTTRRQSIIKIC